MNNSPCNILSIRIHEFDTLPSVESFILREPTLWQVGGSSIRSYEALCILVPSVCANANRVRFLFFDNKGSVKEFLRVGEYTKIEKLTELVSREKKYVCFVPVGCDTSVPLWDPEYHVSVKFHRERKKFLCLV